MEQSTLAIIIIVIAIISFAAEKIPLAMTAILASLAMGIFGIIDITKVYSDFGSLASVMCASMMIVGNSLFDNGVAQAMGDKLLGMGFGKSEKLFLVVMAAVACFLSAFLSNSAVVAMMIPLVGSVTAKSNGKITNKNVLMAVGMGAGAGGFCTLAGSTPQLVAQGIFEETAGLKPMAFFDLAKAGAPLCIILVLYFATVGHWMEKKVLKYEDVVIGYEDPNDKPVYVKWKMVLTSVVMIGCVVGFISGIWNIAVVAVLGAAILITTKCVPLKKAFHDIDWNTIIILSASQGFAKGLETSGAGAMIAEGTINLFGANATPMVILAVLFVVTVILTNFMSNVAVASMILPIAVSMAVSLGVNPTTYGMAVVIACQIAFFTPIGTPCVTQTLVGGYRYMDFVKIGFPLCVILTIVGIFMIPLAYGF